MSLNELKSFKDMPENIVLEIFMHFTIQELCRIRRVCKTWRRIASDRSLWKTVDLRPHRLHLPSLKKVIKNHLSDALISFHIAGCMQEGKASLSWSRPTLSDALLRDLKEKCPNLKQFDVSYANLCGININFLPSTIEIFVLTKSLIPCGWFKSLTEDSDALQKLSHLDLTDSSKLTDSDLEALCTARPALKVLKLNGCYRLTGLGMKGIIRLSELVLLEMSSTRCDDLSLHHLCRASKKLEKLNLSFCKEIHNQSLQSIATLPCLKFLNLEGCEKVTDVESLRTGCKILQNLNIKNTSIKIAECKLTLPNCEILWNEYNLNE